MLTIGIDSVDITRFNEWPTYSPQRLSRIFTEQEITYCLKEPIKAPERMAVRFAAKEAFYKAVSSLLKKPLPFSSVGPVCSITKHHDGNPSLEVVWQKLELPEYQVEVSLTHTSTIATALVIITD